MIEPKSFVEPRSSADPRRTCEDYKENPITWSPGYKKLTCQQISEKEKCDLIWFKTNRPLWYVCQKSCNKCNDIIPGEDDPFLVDQNPTEATQKLSAAVECKDDGCEESSGKAEDPIIATPFLAPQECSDYKDHPITWSPGQRKITCQQINEKGKCDLIWFKTNKPLWQLCQRSCNRCDETLSAEEKSLIAEHSNKL